MSDEMRRFDRSEVDVAFRRLMAKTNQQAAVHVWREILRETLHFWERNCHVVLEDGAREAIEGCKEIGDAVEATRTLRPGRPQGGNGVLSLRGLAHEVNRATRSPQIRNRNRSYRRRLDVAAVAMESLLVFRNIDSHTNEGFDDPGTVAALAGTLLMLVENAGQLTGDLGQATERLRESARGALDLCVRQLDPEDEADGESATDEAPEAAERGQADESEENLSAGKGYEGTNGVIREVLARLEDQVRKIGEALAVVDSRYRKVGTRAGPSERSREVGGNGPTEALSGEASLTAAVGVLQESLTEVLGEVRKLSSGNLAERDLRFLQSLVKKDIGMRSDLGDLADVRAAVLGVKEAVEALREGVEGAVAAARDDIFQVGSAVDGLRGATAEGSDLEEAVAQRVVQALAEQSDRLPGADVIEQAASTGTRSVLMEMTKRPSAVPEPGAVGPLIDGLRQEWSVVGSGVDDLKHDVSNLTATVNALREEASAAKPPRGEPTVTSEDEAFEWMPSSAVDLLTPQQAVNRLVALRNVINREMGVEFYHCILQRKFIDQIIAENIRAKDDWLKADGRIGAWRADRRNRDQGKAVGEQWERYGERIAEILDRIMDDTNEQTDDEIPF